MQETEHIVNTDSQTRKKMALLIGGLILLELGLGVTAYLLGSML